MINYIKGLLSDLFGSAPAVVVEEVKVVKVKATTKQRAGTVAEVKLAPLPTTTLAPAKKRKPYYGKKKPAAKATPAKTK